MKESHKSDVVPERESFLAVSILLADQKYSDTWRDQRQFFRSLHDMLFLKRGKMTYHDHSVGFCPFTISSLETVFTLDDAYLPHSKQTGNLQGSWKGADGSCRALAEPLANRFCSFCAFSLKNLQVAESKGFNCTEQQKVVIPGLIK